MATARTAGDLCILAACPIASEEAVFFGCDYICTCNGLKAQKSRWMGDFLGTVGIFFKVSFSLGWLVSNSEKMNHPLFHKYHPISIIPVLSGSYLADRGSWN